MDRVIKMVAERLARCQPICQDSQLRTLYSSELHLKELEEQDPLMEFSDQPRRWPHHHRKHKGRHPTQDHRRLLDHRKGLLSKWAGRYHHHLKEDSSMEVWTLVQLQGGRLLEDSSGRLADSMDLAQDPPVKDSLELNVEKQVEDNQTRTSRGGG